MTIAIIAQADPSTGLMARATAFLAGLGAGLATLALSGVLIYVCWQILKNLLSGDITPEKLGKAVLVGLLAAFVVGGLPGWIGEAFTYGQTFVLTGS